MTLKSGALQEEDQMLRIRKLGKFEFTWKSNVPFLGANNPRIIWCDVELLFHYDYLRKTCRCQCHSGTYFVKWICISYNWSYNNATIVCVSVKVKRWVEFKGEQEPTSIPGISAYIECFSFYLSNCRNCSIFFYNILFQWVSLKVLGWTKLFCYAPMGGTFLLIMW